MTEKFSDVLGYKGKTVFNSVTILGEDKYDNNLLAFEIEPQDSTYTNLYKSKKRYNKAIDNIFLKAYNFAVKKGYEGAYIYLYDDNGSSENLLTDWSMSQVYKLIK